LDEAPMLLDVTLGTDDLARGIRFYDPVMATLGISRLRPGAAGWAGWGMNPASDYGLWLCPPFDGKTASVGNGTMLTFAARSAAEVRAFHRAALANGGTDEGAPGTRARYSPTFYVAYIRDPDGHKLAAVFEPYDAACDMR
jgi:catechol 2,3-dioxygenase-like lactoylglutathione lyase family enzyme